MSMEVTPLKLSFVTSYASILSAQLWHNPAHEGHRSAVVAHAKASMTTVVQFWKIRRRFFCDNYLSCLLYAVKLTSSSFIYYCMQQCYIYLNTSKLLVRWQNIQEHSLTKTFYHNFLDTISSSNQDHVLSFNSCLLIACPWRSIFFTKHLYQTWHLEV